MRRATAYSSSFSPIALVLVVCLHLFRYSLLLKCAAQLKIAKNTVNCILVVQGHRC